MPLLEIKNLVGGYGLVRALHGIDLTVDEGSVVAVLGANGAGKTTLLRALCGMLPQAHGSVVLDGEEILGKAPEKIARLGVCHVPEGRGTFAALTVGENLEVGAWRRKDRRAIASDRDKMYDLFPRLKERRAQTAGSLSGGEQQMLAVARGLMGSPRLLLLDEPSLGLAPLIVRQLYATLATIVAEMRLSTVVVEQNAHVALQIAQDAHLLEVGVIIRSGIASSMREDPEIRRSYLGI
jgi:branched-chain amino acid transport system ATP-binding protein